MLLGATGRGRNSTEVGSSTGATRSDTGLTGLCRIDGITIGGLHRIDGIAVGGMCTGGVDTIHSIVGELTSFLLEVCEWSVAEVKQ
eukprot:9042211-Ditylum_brightwellii.AAC.1